jgi:hypothetical protein
MELVMFELFVSFVLPIIVMAVLVNPMPTRSRLRTLIPTGRREGHAGAAEQMTRTFR